jgi:thiol-disulfide isomerase/thioredoxin
MRGKERVALAVLLALLAALALTGAQCQGRGPRAPAARAQGEGASPGQGLAPDFTLTPVAGGKASRLSDHKGKVVLLNFFTTWCGYCNQEAPELEKLHQQYAAQGLEIVGVCMDSEDQAAVKEFIGKHGVTYAIVGKSPEAAGAYGIRGYPTTLVIDREGKQRAQFIGAAPVEQIEAALKPLLGGETAPETAS